ncbi:hypothetical protein O9X94_22140 [Agrobacterium leguminum]|uniref:AAA+ ATPase domain-containing protein n=1 Tax=Agrobacterium leguminum TaxID=2792015 RepID=A0A9X3KHY8_9HYPH|nr:AAA family ATPase [Agrobacterium leguminum]MCZ7912031.1 hypothetical protein [Agrobacterium leguminum]
MGVFEELQHGDVKPLGPICLMGVNGAGKSRFLREIHDQITLSGRRSIYVSAHRDFAGAWSRDIYSHAALDPYQIFDDPRPNRTGPQPDFPTLISHALERAYQKDAQSRNTFVENVARWIESDNQLDRPEKPVYIMPRLLDDLGSVLGRKLILDMEQSGRGGSNFGLKIDVNGVTYPVSSLSSGERQILLFSILMFQETERHVAIFVDEPELHLNEAKAISLWSELESRLSNSTFVYATHSLNFATRPGIRELFIIEAGDSPIKVDANAAIPVEMIKDLVGARVQIRRSGLVPILCEDQGQAMLLADLLPTGRYEPILVNSRDGVIRAISARSEYDKVFSGHPVSVGLIDRDFASDEEISALERSGIYSLPYNDFEACLLHPSLSREFLGITDRAVSHEEYTDALCAAAEKALSETLQKLKASVQLDHAPVITHSFTPEGVTAWADTPRNASAAFEQRANQILQMIKVKDVEGILRNFKGKKVYQHFRDIMRVRKVAVHQPYQSYRTLREIPRMVNLVATVPGLTELRDKIIASH